MNWIVALAGLSGAVAVGAGAFGAHGASGEAAEWLKTGGHYQLAHAVAALLAVQFGVRGVAWLFLAGGAIFAGTLYLMALERGFLDSFLDRAVVQPFEAMARLLTRLDQWMCDAVVPARRRAAFDQADDRDE